MKRTYVLFAGFLIIIMLLASVSACSNDDTTTTSTTTSSTPAETTATTSTSQPTETSTTTSATTSTSTATTTTETSEPTETTTSQALDDAAVRAFADEIATTTMEGFSEADFEKYTRHANDVFKEAILEVQFVEAANVIKDQIGDFVSLTFLNWEIVDNYIVVHYSGEYSEGTIGVLVSFDEDHLVAGQFFE